ncbi:hypothetical protein GSI_12581 [Ganoderma sinense ZZ0214-1]|uniref:Uncharacterized protein n=1 Tax=Ganoderma sinense ZZ0214-1 TaxID=1077348 RepID=A0A2G8RT54_9APHY|nr:hypothetical protein GSI_12581 [Ganoderma sinense ZZ0214-1]
MHKDRGFGYAEDSRRTLAGVLLWDGFVYFITIAIVDAMHMIITLLSINQLLTGSISDITVFSFPLSAIIISRFMLHLQGANSRTTGMASDSQEPTASNIGSLMFERAFGSLGASISPDNFFATEEDDACDEMEMEESNATEGGGRNPQSDVT